MTGEAQQPEDPNVVILAGDKIDVNEITKAFCEIPDLVDVILPVGGKIFNMKFKRMPRRSEYDAMVAHHVGYYSKLPKYGTPAQKNHEWAAFWPMTATEYLEAAVIAELSVEPELTIETTLAWLVNPDSTQKIIKQIETQSNTFSAALTAAAVDIEKKTLSQVRGLPTSSKSASSEQDDSQKSSPPDNSPES